MPFWLASISRKDCGLRRPNLNLNGANLWRPRSLRSLEVELQCLFQIGQSFFFTFTLAGDIDFQALRNKPVSFAPHGSGEQSLYNPSFSHKRNAFSGCGLLQIVIHGSERHTFTKGEIKIGSIVWAEIPSSG